MDVDLSEKQKNAIIEWAISKPAVQGARLYGSRAKGKARPESDVDLALTVEPASYERHGPDGYTIYFFEKDKWAEELANLVGLPVHIERYHSGTHKHVFSFCTACSIVLWERGLSTDRAENLP